MLISLRWLQELLPAAEGGSPLTLAEVDDALTSLGLEVEGSKRCGSDIRDVRVAKLLEVSPHPKADRLNVVQVDIGDGPVQVVCGASNLPEPGGRVAFAPEGSVLPGNFEIGARKLRGVESHGMICSETELEIGSDDEGILILPEDWTPGDRLVDRVPGIEDTVIEISVTPNRPDALGHIGIARDLALKLGRTLTWPACDRAELPEDPSLARIDAGDRCGRYVGVSLEGAEVKASPLWLRVRLHRLGLRAISNVVDVTNYVLMETGQPLHAFDRARLEGGGVVVRRAKDGEPMTTLDGKAIELNSDDLVIADHSRPQALAGVMGGADSMVEAGASQLLLEVAWFKPLPVRRSARRHDFHTDSSHRFERGVDYGEQLDFAVARARQLFTELAGAAPKAQILCRAELPEAPVIHFRPRRIAEVLGMEIPLDFALRVLRGLGLEVGSGDGSSGEPLLSAGETTWRCVPPSHRPDLTREIDLVEEVMRHHGLEELPNEHCVPSGQPNTVLAKLEHRLAERAADALREAGMNELVNFAFVDHESLNGVRCTVPSARRVEVQNPLRIQQGVMRTQLLPGLLAACHRNRAHHARALAMFEVGRVYAWRAPDAKVDEGLPTAAIDRQLPEESSQAVAVLRPARGVEDLDGTSARSLTASMLGVLSRMGYSPSLRAAEHYVGASSRGSAEPGCPPQLHPGIATSLWVEARSGRQCVGFVGELHPELAEAFEVGEGVPAVAVLEVDRLPEVDVCLARELPRFPATARDLSVELPVGVPAAELIEALMAAEARLASTIEPETDGAAPPRLSAGDERSEAIFVVADYRGDGVDPGLKSLSLRLNYRAPDRSVTVDEVQALHTSVVSAALGELSERGIESKIR